MPPRACPPLFERRLDGVRLRLPPGVISEIGSHAGLWADMVGCIRVVPKDALNSMLPDLQRCGSRNHHAAEFFRFVIASQTTVPVDGRGRISIPQLHLEWAGLAPDGAALTIATERGAEIWAPDRLQARLVVASEELRGLHSSILHDQLSLIGE